MGVCGKYITDPSLAMSDAKITIPLDLSNVNVLAVKIEKNRLVISVESTLKGTRCRQS